MTTFSVRVVAAAQQDADAIFAWITSHSPEALRRCTLHFSWPPVVVAIEPFRHAAVPEAATVSADVRQRLFRTRRGRLYRLLYVVVESEVRILRVRGPGQPELAQTDFEKHGVMTGCPDQRLPFSALAPIGPSSATRRFVPTRSGDTMFTR